MFSINYNHTNYGDLVKHFAEKLNAKMKSNFFNFPSCIGDGFFKHINLSDGLQCLIANFKLNQDLHFCRNNSQKGYYILRFDELTTVQNLQVKIDEKCASDINGNRASILLTSSTSDSSYVVTGGAVSKSINVLITKEWLSKYLCVKDVDDYLKNFYILKFPAFSFSSLFPEYKNLFNEVISANTKNDDLEQPCVKRDILTIVENFLHFLNKKINSSQQNKKTKIWHDEVERLMDVETYLMKDFPRPPPSLMFLSRVAAMSVTTLKNKFKKLYGSTLYDYFQKNRMQRAKDLLVLNKYSIKEIGSQLGYSNLSNFTIAFKKEFKSLPSQFSKQALNGI